MTRPRLRLAAAVFFGGGWLVAAAAAQPPDSLPQQLSDYAADFWIYDDVDTGYEEAKETGKPLLVTIRCVP